MAFEEEDDGPVDDPNDPSHPDHDLSEAAGHAAPYYDARGPWVVRRWALLIVASVLIAAIAFSLVRSL